MRKLQIALIAIIIYLSGTVADAYAHPHVFIDPKVILVFKSQVLTKVKIEWYFDDMTSMAILDLYDKNKNNKIEPGEQKTLVSKTFNNFGKFNYYTYMEIDGRDIKYGKPSNFKATVLKNNILHYSFVIPVNKKVSNKMTLWFTDTTNYVAFDFMKKNVSAKQVSGKKPKLQIKPENYLDKLNVVFN